MKLSQFWGSLHSMGFTAQRDRPVHTLEGEAAERIGADL